MKYVAILLCLLFSGGILFAKDNKVLPLVFKSDRLVYTADSLGNRIPDFSYAGYMGGEKEIPSPSPTVYVPLSDVDATLAIQQALDYVGTLKPDINGIRGVVLLQEGDYKVSGSLIIRNSGVILRGNGVLKNVTRLIATGKDRRTLIRICGVNDTVLSKPVKITDSYVPVNALSFNLENNHLLKKGDKIFVYRPSTQSWIDVLGTEHFGGGITSLGWKPGRQDVYWDRTVVSVDGTKVTLDAPITTALDSKHGGGSIIPYSWNGRVNQIGIENISCISEYEANNPKDEAHSWTAITIENAQDIWVRNMVFTHFAGSAVFVDASVKRVTVENCKSLAPVSEIGGLRRNTFFTMGQQCLFLRIHSEQGIHDFGTGFCAAGPNAFVQCYAVDSYSFSGGVESWASGVLFDNVNIDGNTLSYKNRMQEGQGTGWSAANSVFWQCTASLVECFAPPTAQNWAFGTWSEFSGDGLWFDSNNHIDPLSLYYQQLKERLGDSYVDRSNLLPWMGEASSSPSLEVAQALTKLAVTPAMTVSELIDSVIEKNTLPVDAGKAKRFDVKADLKSKNTTAPLQVVNGWLVRGNDVQTGGRHDIRWWSGTIRADYLKSSASPHLTRYVPNQVGTGLTDNVDSVAKWMKDNHVVALDHNYGLWYDRRRDDHERIRRINGDVWAPFYEQPFARSGQGTAYDGLSKYDLTKYNTWYWNRLHQFADLADENGLILLHQNYFQHNIIEAGAHWADSPWRTANNINNVGFPEPVPYAGDKRIFFAEQFYDINHPVRRKLHRDYIRQCLNNFKDNNSVIQFISAEYTGPLHFVEFWLDVIGEWEKETGKKQLIALSTTKDVQDAILADPVRSKLVDVIDIRYWLYRADGTAYEPKGGVSLAPRQHARLEKTGKVVFASVYRAVSEYKERFPDKAVTYYSDSYPQQAWAVFMAKGSLACIPSIENEKFLKDASKMEIEKDLNVDGQYVLGDATTGYIVYAENAQVNLDLSAVKGKFNAYWINPKTGQIEKLKQQINGGTAVTLLTKGVLWLEKK